MIRRSLLAFVFFLSLFFVNTVPAASGQPHSQLQRAKCISDGLAPISAHVRVSVAGLPESSTPSLRISWSGTPLPVACNLERSVGQDVEVRFADVPEAVSFSSGLPSRWLLFWTGKRRNSHGHAEYQGSSSEGDHLGCIKSVRARLRYRVLAPGGTVLAQRVRVVPAQYRGCSNEPGG